MRYLVPRGVSVRGRWWGRCGRPRAIPVASEEDREAEIGVALADGFAAVPREGGAVAAGVAREEMDALKKELTALMTREKKLATKDELEAFHEDTKKLLKSFIW